MRAWPWAACSVGLTIRSNPPGALVYVDDYQIGTTPVSTSFIYYGTRKIRLVLSGYETKTILQPVPTPWYQYPGLDFVTETLVPGEIRDERVVEYQLTPQVIVPSQQLLGRAENLRHELRAPSAPLPPAAPSYGPGVSTTPGMPALAARRRRDPANHCSRSREPTWFRGSSESRRGCPTARDAARSCRRTRGHRSGSAAAPW